MKTELNKFEQACDWVANNRLKTVIGAVLALTLFNLAMPDTPHKPVEPKVKTAQELQADVQNRASWILKKTIEKTAKDPDSIKYRNPRFLTNGYCVEFNGKNSFGAYAGYHDACYFTDKNGKDTITVDGQ